MKVYLKRNFSTNENLRLFLLDNELASEYIIKRIYVDKNPIPRTQYTYVYDRTGILFNYILHNDVILEAELEKTSEM